MLGDSNPSDRESSYVLKKIMIYFWDVSFMEQVSQYMYNYALILQIGPKNSTCSGVPIDISFLGGGTPSRHDKAWFRARNLEHSIGYLKRPDLDGPWHVCG